MGDKNKNGLSRREMLAAGAAAAGAMSAANALAQEAEGRPMPGGTSLPMAESDKLRWAIVGLGSFGINQVIPGFADAKQSRMTAFVSGNPQKAADLGELYGVSRFYNYENFDDIADDPEIDCVYIVLPVGLHAEYTIRALQAGKHVLCEKPMCSTPDEARAMIAAAEAANRQLGVAYRVHFEPNNRDAQRRIRAGELGTIRHISADHGFSANPDFAPHKWRLEQLLGGGGSMYDIGIYGLNTSLMMLEGDRVTSVSAAYSTPPSDDRFTEVEGGIDYRVRMASGINIQGSSSYCYSPYVSRQRYFGANGSIEMQPATTYDDNRISLEVGGRREFRAGDPMSQFSAQLDGFSEAARSNTAHLTPGTMGLRDMEIVEAMYQSADAGGAVIEVDIAV